MDTEESLKQIYGVARVVGIIMFSSLLICAMAVEFAARNPGVVGRPALNAVSPQQMRLIFSILSVLCYAACVYIKKSTIRRASGKGIDAVKRLYMSAIIIFSICEAPAVFGIVLFFSGGKRMDFYSMLAVTLLMFVIFFPRLAEWKGIVQKRS